MSESVNHPDHYGGDTIYETIKVQEAKLSHDEFVGAMKFQVAKYLDRSGKKAAEVIEDWRKAQFYLNYLIDYETRCAAGMTGEGRVASLVGARQTLRPRPTGVTRGQALKEVRDIQARLYRDLGLHLTQSRGKLTTDAVRASLRGAVEHAESRITKRKGSRA